MTNSVAIVGAGNIGSRHLQGLAAAKRVDRIYLVDPSDGALQTAAARWREAAGEDPREPVLLRDPSGLPADLRLLIVATTARFRRQALEGALDGRAPPFVLLEKFLFQAADDFGAAAALLERAGARTWVNTPRPIWPGYRELKAQLTDGEPLICRVSGPARASIASNTIHFIDLMAFLTGERRFDFAGTRLAADYDASRHAGGVEFFGRVAASTPGGSFFEFSVLADQKGPITVDLLAPGRRWLIRESQGRAFALSEANDWSYQESPFAVPFQSQLTGKVVDEILDTGTCGLTPYAASSELHLQLLDVYLQRLREDQPGIQACPIT